MLIRYTSGSFTYQWYGLGSPTTFLEAIHGSVYAKHSNPYMRFDLIRGPTARAPHLVI